jgi:hypothetical protein
LRKVYVSYVGIRKEALEKLRMLPGKAKTAGLEEGVGMGKIAAMLLRL